MERFISSLAFPPAAVGRGDGHAQPFASNAHAVQREIDIIRQVQRQQIQRASHPGPESLRPKMRDNRSISSVNSGSKSSCLLPTSVALYLMSILIRAVE